MIAKKSEIYENKNIRPIPNNWALVNGKVVIFPKNFSLEKMRENKKIKITEEGEIEYE